MDLYDMLFGGVVADEPTPTPPKRARKGSGVRAAPLPEPVVVVESAEPAAEPEAPPPEVEAVVPPLPEVVVETASSEPPPASAPAPETPVEEVPSGQSEAHRKFFGAVKDKTAPDVLFQPEFRSPIQPVGGPTEGLRGHECCVRRKALGLSIQEVAEAAGLHPLHVQRIECGMWSNVREQRLVPTLDRLQACANR
jgi:hypothetical protein